MCERYQDCAYGHSCNGCLYNRNESKRSKTGLDTKDLKAYKRNWKRRKREQELAEEFPFLYADTKTEE